MKSDSTKFLSGTQLERILTEYDTQALHQSAMATLVNNHSCGWFRNREAADQLTIEVPTALFAALLQKVNRELDKPGIEDFLRESHTDN